MSTRTHARELRDALAGPDEIALVDVREEGEFSRSHLFFAACIARSQLELRVGELVPRLDTRVVLVDADGAEDGPAALAASRLEALGYRAVSVLDGGCAGWKAAGGELFSGVNVPSKAFGEFVEHWQDTPRLAAGDLQAMQARGEKLVVLDSRPMDEFRRMSIPGGVDCPGAELVYRVHEMAPDPDTTVVVNCAGRTRSIIGAQSLINAGVPNRVFALKNGTMGWELAGFTLARGLEHHAPAPGQPALARASDCAAQVARRFGVTRIDADTLARWRADTARTCYLLDVRTEQEFLDGHWPGARHAAGGQLVQATDEYIVTRNARIVLADGADGVRATMTAHWLIQLGWPEVAVLAQAAPEPETGAAARPLLGFVPFAARVDAPALAVALESDTPPALIDLASSLDHKRGHIPGAAWGIRARIGACVDALASQMASLPTLVLTSDDGVLAHYAAHELATQRPGLDVRVLDGGTAAWRAIGGALETGIDQALTAIDDVWWKPYDHERGVEQAMKDYLSWEVGLVEQVEREGLARFRRF